MNIFTPKEIDTPLIKRKRLNKILSAVIFGIAFLFLLYNIYDSFDKKTLTFVSNEKITTATEELTAEQFLSNYDHNRLINSMSFSKTGHKFSKIHKNLPDSFSYQKRFDNTDLKHVFSNAHVYTLGKHYGVIYNTSTGQKTYVKEGPWMKFSNCGILHFDSGCSYGEYNLFTDQGYIFTLIDTSRANAYSDDRVAGLYFYDGNMWTKLSNGVTSLKTLRYFTEDNLFVKSNGCDVYFQQDVTGDIKKYFRINACKALDLPEPELELRPSVTIYNTPTVYIGGWSRNLKENDDHKKITVSLETMPIRCVDIYPNERKNFLIDFGDGETAQATCGANNFHTYNQEGDYEIKILYEDQTLYTDRVVIETY